MKFIDLFIYLFIHSYIAKYYKYLILSKNKLNLSNIFSGLDNRNIT